MNAKAVAARRLRTWQLCLCGRRDIVISLRRPDGNQPRNVRLIQAVSRFDDPGDLLIELTDDGYRSLGAPGDSAKAQASENVLSAIPKSKKQAATIQELVQITGESRAHLQKILDDLLEARRILRSGTGRKGSPFRYFKG